MKLSSAWDLRIARATELIQANSAARELLHFYLQLVRLQKKIYQTVASSNEHEVAVLAPYFQDLIAVIGREPGATPPPQPPREDRQGIPDLGPCIRCNLQIEGSGVSPDDVTEAMEMGPAYVPVSLDQPVAAADGQDNRSVAEQIGGADPELERVEMRDVLDRAMEHLTPRERAIMAMRFYEQMSQSEIARRLGISQMHVSRLQRAALEQLRKYVPQESAG